jgi:hypothetical protein
MGAMTAGIKKTTRSHRSRLVDIKSAREKPKSISIKTTPNTKINVTDSDLWKKVSLNIARYCPNPTKTLGIVGTIDHR